MLVYDKKALEAQIIQKAKEDPAFKARLLSDPRKAVEEALDVSLPQSLTVEVLQESETKVHIVLPPDELPVGAIPDEVLETVVGGARCDSWK